MSDLFKTYGDPQGNLVMEAGMVIAYHATTETFPIGGGRIAPLTVYGDPFYTAAAGTGASFQGGSGRNAQVTGGPSTLVPAGWFLPTAPDEWASTDFPACVLTFFPDGHAELSDGTDIVAASAVGASTLAPSGSFPATAYGEATYNGGLPFALTVDYEGAAPWPARPLMLLPGSSTVPGGYYTATGWGTWECDSDPAWTLGVLSDGSGVLSDGVDTVATKAAGGQPYDPAGDWEATPYAAAYGLIAPLLLQVRLGRAYPQAGYLWVELVLDAGTNWVTGTAGPFFGPTLPANSPTLCAVPIVYSDGAGSVVPIQQGPIHWKP